MTLYTALISPPPSAAPQAVRDWRDWYQSTIGDRISLPDTGDFTIYIAVAGLLLIGWGTLGPSIASSWRRISTSIPLVGPILLRLGVSGSIPHVRGGSVYLFEPQHKDVVPREFIVRGAGSTFEGVIVVERQYEGDWAVVAVTQSESGPPDRPMEGRPFLLHVSLPPGKHLLRVGAGHTVTGDFEGPEFEVKVEDTPPNWRGEDRRERSNTG